MNDLIRETWLAISGIIGNIVDTGLLVGAWLLDVLLILHNDMPRVEGLLVGILFAWFFVHREKNPLVRALAVPLKIILDILDIIWDETIEAAADLYATIREKITSVLLWAKDLARKGAGAIVGRLAAVRDWLTAKFKKED